MRDRPNLRECEQSRVEAPTRHDCCKPNTSRRTDAQPQLCLLNIICFITSAYNEMAMLADTLRPKQRYQRHFQRQRGPSRHQPLPTTAYSALERCVLLEQGSINSFNKLGGRHGCNRAELAQQTAPPEFFAFLSLTQAWAPTSLLRKKLSLAAYETTYAEVHLATAYTPALGHRHQAMEGK